MKRTIVDARRALEEDLIPTVSDHVAKQARQELAAGEAKARRHADSYISEREAEIITMRDAALRELTETRDKLDVLAAQGRDARIPTAEYTARLRELSQRTDRAEDALGQCEELTDRLDEIEQDPIAWFDALTARIPRLVLDWSW